MKPPLRRWLDDPEGAPDPVTSLLRAGRAGPDPATGARVWSTLPAAAKAGASVGAGAAWGLHLALKPLIAVLVVGIAAKAVTVSRGPAPGAARSAATQGPEPPKAASTAPFVLPPASARDTAENVVVSSISVPPSHPAAGRPSRPPAVAPRGLAAAARLSEAARPVAAVVSANGGGADPAAGAQGEVSEVGLLDAAFASLARDPGRALELTDEALRRFPQGAMQHERETLAIEALARLGRVDAARARGASFLVQQGSSVHAARVRRVLARIDQTSRDSVTSEGARPHSPE